MEAVVLRKRTKLEPLGFTRSCNPLNVLLLLFPTAARPPLQDFSFPSQILYDVTWSCCFVLPWERADEYNEGFVSSSYIEYSPKRHLSFESVIYYNTYENLTDCFSS